MPKRRTRKQRKEVEIRRKERKDSKRAQEMASVLAALGVLEEFRKQPASFRKRFSRLRYPRPEIVVDATAENEPEALDIANDLSQALEEEHLVIEETARTVSLLDFFCIGVPLWHFSGLTKSKPTGIKSANHFLDCMYTATNDHISSNMDWALGTLAWSLECALIEYSRIDRRLFWISLDFPLEEGPAPECFLRVTVHVHRAEELRRKIDGVPKRLYRCGAGAKLRIDWVSWTSADLGLTGPEQALPVFIDGGHALRNLRDRVTVAQDNGMVEDCIWASLRSPEVTWTKEGDKFLVAYRLREHKIGYFVFRALDDMYVAITFLFLTMDGTPEGQNLWEKLRLSKRDKQYTGLDRLSTYVLSDMKDDPELAAVFEDCGCAHLFSMTEEELTDRQLRGSAADVRKYLGDRLDRAVTEIRQRAAGVRDE